MSQPLVIVLLSAAGLFCTLIVYIHNKEMTWFKELLETVKLLLKDHEQRLRTLEQKK